MVRETRSKAKAREEAEANAQAKAKGKAKAKAATAPGAGAGAAPGAPASATVQPGNSLAEAMMASRASARGAAPPQATSVMPPQGSTAVGQSKGKGNTKGNAKAKAKGGRGGKGAGVAKSEWDSDSDPGESETLGQGITGAGTGTGTGTGTQRPASSGRGSLAGAPSARGQGPEGRTVPVTREEAMQQALATKPRPPAPAAAMPAAGRVATAMLAARRVPASGSGAFSVPAAAAAAAAASAPPASVVTPTPTPTPTPTLASVITTPTTSQTQVQRPDFSRARLPASAAGPRRAASASPPTTAIPASAMKPAAVPAQAVPAAAPRFQLQTGPAQGHASRQIDLDEDEELEEEEQEEEAEAEAEEDLPDHLEDQGEEDRAEGEKAEEGMHGADSGEEDQEMELEAADDERMEMEERQNRDQDQDMLDDDALEDDDADDNDEEDDDGEQRSSASQARWLDPQVSTQVSSSSSQAAFKSALNTRAGGPSSLEHPPVQTRSDEIFPSAKRQRTAASGRGGTSTDRLRAAFAPETGAGEATDLDRQDLRDLQLVPNHEKRPIWVYPSGRIIFETFHPRAAEVTDFLMAVAEPVSRPELIHEYQLKMLSLNAAVSSGIEIEKIVQVLERLSKNKLEPDFLEFIKKQGESVGKTKLMLRSGRHFLEAETLELLAKLCSDADIVQSMVRQDLITPEGQVMIQAAVDAVTELNGGREPRVPSLEINSSRIEDVKAAAHRMGLPLLQEYDFRQDRTATNPPLQAHLKPETSVRAHQLASLSKVFVTDGVAKSGIIVLPCGAGKTLVGISACIRIGRRALVLTSTAVAVDQWRRQFLQFTTLSPSDIYMLTADSKRPIENCENRACVVITTYSMLGFTGRRSGDAELLLSQIQQLEWGIMVVDEVQVMPAKTFRTVATTVKAHCSLGLTATLVREDELVHDLHWLIGPKLYEASWQQLQDEGFLAKVRCVEVWCEMSKAFFSEYLKSVPGRDGHLRRALWTCNPNKLIACEFLIRFHEQRGDKTIVFSDNILLLEDFAKKLGRYYISGKVEMRERMQILGAFANSSTCNTIFLSKVGDNAIDIPNASVIVQISSHYGSRRQEAQRLGRILRPKPKAFDAKSKFNAFFYTLVSRDTPEMYYASRRQQFLVEQGYNYHILRDESVRRMRDKTFHYSSPEAQNELLTQVLASVGVVQLEAEDDEVALFDPSRDEQGRPFRQKKTSKANPAASATATATTGETLSDARPSGAAAGSASSSSAASGPAAAAAAAAAVREQRLSMAALSGGTDGSYSTLQQATKRKPEF